MTSGGSGSRSPRPGGAGSGSGETAPPGNVRGMGVDLAQIPRFRRAVERWDNRFLRKIFTDDEIAYCRDRRDPIPHLAARFAAKEAALKALGTGLALGTRWRDIEVRRAPGEAPTLVLTGRCQTLAAARGADSTLLSLTHDGDYALAQVLLLNTGVRS